VVANLQNEGFGTSKIVAAQVNQGELTVWSPANCITPIHNQLTQLPQRIRRQMQRRFES
jgi:hypothetical protein